LLEPLLPLLADRSICFWIYTAMSFLLWGRPVIPSPINLVVYHKELLLDLFVWSLEKEGYADLYPLVS
jgi:hypothetical protein